MAPLALFPILLLNFITFNLSPSVPQGLYIRNFDSIEHGDYVRFSLPDRRVDLLKKVVALSGDHVCITKSRGYRVNGVLLSTGRKKGVSEYEYCGYVSPGQIFVFGPHERSYDSRYYGAIHENDVTGQYRYVVLFSKNP